MAGGQENRLRLERCSIGITTQCNLKCKLCATASPYFEKQYSYPLEQVRSSVDSFFEIIEHVGDFAIFGGEPLLHKELTQVIQKVAEKANQIDRIILYTNGTINFSEPILKTLESFKKHACIFLSNYGKLSKHSNALISEFEKRDLKYRNIQYHGEHLHYGGWVDFGDSSLKLKSQEERDALGSKCNCIKMRTLAIFGDKIYACGRSFHMSALGSIQGDDETYVDLNLPINQRTESLQRLLSVRSVLSCGNCNGYTDRSQRHHPAEQLA